jgi:hypothetical protein
VQSFARVSTIVWVIGCGIGLAGCGGIVWTLSGTSGQAAQKQASQRPEELKPVPPTPIAIKKAELDEPTWDPAWNMLIEQALPANLLSSRREKEVRALCPRFRHMSKGQRRAFWAYFFQALAGAEAGLKPTSDVHHTEPAVDVTDLVTHLPVHQEGLLQLTYMDDLRYGCNFDWEKDRHLPEHDPSKSILLPGNNLLCGLRIVEDQLMKRHEPLLSDKSYWSTLRPDNPSFAVFRKQMANVPAYCELHPKHREPMESSPAPLVEASNHAAMPGEGRGADEAQSRAEAATAKR